MLRVIILLKDDVRRIKTIMLQGIEQFILQILKVKATIYPTSILVAYPTPSYIIHPQIMMGPPNLAVPTTSLTLGPSPGFFHTHLHPSDPR